MPMVRRVLMMALLVMMVAAWAGLKSLPALTLVLPHTLQPETMRVLVWQSGSFGGSGGPMDVKAGVFSYPVGVHPGARQVKLLLYHPGYRVVGAVFDAKALKTPITFTPTVTPLEMVTVHGTVTDGTGKPLPGEKIVISHVLGEMAYFGYVDGMIFPATDASFTTDAAGAFTLRLPVLSADPFYTTNPKDQAKPAVPEFQIAPPADAAKRTAWPCDYVPASFQVHHGDDAKPFTIRKLYRAKLIVRVPTAARTAHGILPTDRVVVYVGASGGRSFGNLQQAGEAFTGTFIPGDYHVMVEAERNNKLVIGFTVAEKLPLREHEEQVVEVK
jgi:hypothetical protein